MSHATLETRIGAGQPVLICPRCGFWAYYGPKKGNLPLPKLDIDAYPCPDCKQPLDAVEPRN